MNKGMTRPTREKNLWILDDSGVPRPEVDQAAWEAWKAGCRIKPSGKVAFGTKVLGWRFTGWELGLNPEGNPLLWETVFWEKGEVQFTGKFPTLELMDYHMFWGVTLANARTHLNRWQVWRMVNHYARWRKTLGGWSWRNVLALRKKMKSDSW